MEMWKPVAGTVISLGHCPNEVKAVGWISPTVIFTLGHCHGYNSYLVVLQRCSCAHEEA